LYGVLFWLPFLFALQKDETARLMLCGSIFEKLLHQKAF